MTQVSTIRVIAVDDHDLLRSGLRLAIETVADIELVGEAASGSEAIDLCQRLQPDVMLLDLVMPDMDGVTVIQQLRQQHSGVRVIALTSFVDDNLVHAALSAGAVSYLLKNIPIDDLTSAIRKAYRGETTLSPEATQALVHAATLPPPPQYSLTTREKQVLGMLVKGRSNKEIAQELSIGLSTVKKHVSSLLDKMGTVSRTEAVSIAIRFKLVDF